MTFPWHISCTDVVYRLTACKQTNTLPTCLWMAGPMLIAVARYTRGEGSTIRGLPGESRSTELTELACESCGTRAHLHPQSMREHIWMMNFLDCRFKRYSGELRSVCKQENKNTTITVEPTYKLYNT